MDTMSNIIVSLSENLQLVIDKLQEGTDGRQSETFSLVEFWKQFESSAKNLSTQATYMSMMFSKPPAPSIKDCQTMINKVESATLMFVSVYYGLPKSQGKSLHKVITSHVIRTVRACKNLVNSVHSGQVGSPGQLQSTGSVWECCDTVVKLPQDNKEVVMKNGRDTLGLVNDALEELTDAQNDEMKEADLDDDDPTWTDDERKLLSPALGLLKATKSCLKKSLVALRHNGKCTSPEKIGHLDELNETLARISPVVDDLAIVLYPPINKNNMVENAEVLSDVLRTLLKLARDTHITTEDDQVWVEFLSTAVGHNLDKIISLTS